jgi:hypothetical protein
VTLLWLLCGITVALSNVVGVFAYKPSIARCSWLRNDGTCPQSRGCSGLPFFGSRCGKSQQVGPPHSMGCEVAKYVSARWHVCASMAPSLTRKGVVVGAATEPWPWP